CKSRLVHRGRGGSRTSVHRRACDPRAMAEPCGGPGTRHAGSSRQPARSYGLRRELVQHPYVTDAHLSTLRGQHRAARHDGRVVPDVVPRVRADLAGRAAVAARRRRAGRSYGTFAVSSSYALSSTPFNVSAPRLCTPSNPGKAAVAAIA